MFEMEGRKIFVEVRGYEEVSQLRDVQRQNYNSFFGKQTIWELSKSSEATFEVFLGRAGKGSGVFRSGSPP
jgi:hypothetical protein